jgi:hypothetical protein
VVKLAFSIIMNDNNKLVAAGGFDLKLMTNARQL